MMPIIELVCPRCRTRLKYENGEKYQCAPCRHIYESVGGIPDFRISDPPYVSREREKVRIQRLLEQYGQLDYQALVRFLVYELDDVISTEQKARALKHRLTLPQRTANRFGELENTLKESGFHLKPNQCILDLGCGSGEGIREFLQRQARVVGLDISYEELIIAKKWCEEQGSDNFFLVAANAEALPFADGAFAMIYSMDVIEHVASQPAFLNETNRVLQPRGAFLFNSPNRFSLLAPEPHVGLWWMGYMPRKMMDPYSRLRGKGRYIGKRLLSYRELGKMLKRVFPSYQILKRLPNPRAKSFLGRLYKWFFPYSAVAFSQIAELHTVIVRKV